MTMFADGQGAGRQTVPAHPTPPPRCAAATHPTEPIHSTTAKEASSR
jgi:hypothetical protein